MGIFVNCSCWHCSEYLTSNWINYSQVPRLPELSRDRDEGCADEGAIILRMGDTSCDIKNLKYRLVGNSLRNESVSRIIYLIMYNLNYTSIFPRTSGKTLYIPFSLSQKKNVTLIYKIIYYVARPAQVLLKSAPSRRRLPWSAPSTGSSFRLHAARSVACDRPPVPVHTGADWCIRGRMCASTSMGLSLGLGM